MNEFVKLSNDCWLAAGDIRQVMPNGKGGLTVQFCVDGRTEEFNRADDVKTIQEYLAARSWKAASPAAR